MRKFKNNRAITLVALVITIVIMLILAGITLSLTLGDNGIITRAKEATTKASQSDVATTVDLAFATCYIEKLGNESSITASELQEEIENLGYTLDEDVTLSEGVFTVKINGITVTKNVSTGEVTVNGVPTGTSSGNGSTSTAGKVELKVGTTSLKGLSNAELQELYGSTVTGHNITGVDGWQLFYDDTQYIYLIASDYVRNSYLPNELTKESGDSDTTPKYKAWFTTSTSGGSNYTGSIMENSPWASGSNAPSLSTSNYMISNYLHYIGSPFNTTATNPNLRAVAYMMDTNVWKNFAGNVTGAFAMGGPTLEMYVLSYNVKHSTELQPYTDFSSTSKSFNSYGYKAAWKATNPSWTNILSGLDTSSDNMWVKGASRAYDCWLASPAPSENVGVRSIWSEGKVSYHWLGYTNFGFRPLVAIPKSSLK